MPTTLIKLGGSIITKKRESKPQMDVENVSRIAEEISAFLERTDSNLVIVHGAGSYGHPIAEKYDLAEGLNGNALPFAECQALMNRLNSFVCTELAAKKVPAYPFQISAGSISRDKKLVNVTAGVMKKLLSVNAVPVAFGTPAFDENLGCSIISGDQIISLLSSELEASRVVFATDVDGIFDKNPESKDAKLIEALTLNDLEKIEAGSSGSTDVTGGMKGKINWIRKMRNLECRVINGNLPGVLSKAILGETHKGTIIKL